MTATDLELWTIVDHVQGGEIKIDLSGLSGQSLTRSELWDEMCKFARALLGDRPSFTINRNVPPGVIS